jgi:basic membrane protein A
MALDQHNKSLLTPAMLKKAEQIKADIKSGKIKVPDYYQIKK